MLSTRMSPTWCAKRIYKKLSFGWEIRRWWCGRHGCIDVLVISKKMERSQSGAKGEERWGSWCLMGDAPFACLLMSDSLVGHYDQRQESSWKLFKPINDYWPFIVLKVKKVQRILQQPRLDRVGKWSFFLDWRHRDLLFRYHLRWNWILFIFRWKIGHKGSTFGHTSDMKPMELDTFCFS